METYFALFIFLDFCMSGRFADFRPKIAIFQMTGKREGELPLPPAFQYLILMIWRACDSNLVMISSMSSKYQVFKVGMTLFQLFYEMKLKTSKFKKSCHFWSQLRCSTCPLTSFFWLLSHVVLLINTKIKLKTNPTLWGAQYIVVVEISWLPQQLMTHDHSCWQRRHRLVLS